jgi:nucleotide-binding universal stress UspA family protein
MKTILVATDFSAVARNATAYAGYLAKKMHAKIILFHTYSIPTSVTDIAFMMVSAEEMQKENEDRIKKDAEKLFANFGVEVEWLVRIGIPSDEIKILADEKNADLVIMAIWGEGASNKFLGSTTLSTIQKIKKPVLVLPHSAMFNEINNITYATDFSYLINPDSYTIRSYTFCIFKKHKRKQKMIMKQKINSTIFLKISHTHSVLLMQKVSCTELMNSHKKITRSYW